MFESESTSSPGASPVRMSPPQARVPGSEEHAPVCGSTWRGSSARYARIGYSLRTSLLSALEELTGFSLIWRRSGTTHGRWWWVLGRSERHTGEIASGSWPAATATPYGTNQGGAAGRVGPVRPSLERLARGEWATPNTMTGGQTSRGGDRKGEKLLGGQVRKDWATPQAHDAHPGHASRVGRMGTIAGTRNLNDEAALWSTPTARDRTSRGGDRKGEKLLGGQVRKDWATPRAEDSTGNTRPSIDRGSLRDGDTLTSATARAGLPAPESRSTNGSSRGSLNSRWVLQLMGLPADWCDLSDGEIETLSRRPGTASFRKSSSKSDGRS